MPPLEIWNKNMWEVRSGIKINIQSGPILAVMAVAGHNQNASGSDLAKVACLLGT